MYGITLLIYPYAVEGFNDFTKTVVPNLHLPSKYEKELSNPVFPAQFAQEKVVAINKCDKPEADPKKES